jgi:creatinine amidohydrolase
MSTKDQRQAGICYDLMFGREAIAAIKSFPVGYLPVGCLERHGDHLPMGLDTLKAHQICCILAKKFGGVVFPPHHYAGIHRFSEEEKKKYTGEWGNIYTDDSAKSSLIDIINQVALTDIRCLILYSGHYPKCQLEMIKNIAQNFKNHSTFTVIPFAEAMVLDGDHAGISETSIMLYLERELVRMDRIGMKNYEDHGWQQQHSPENATFGRGKRDIDRIMDYLKTAIEEALDNEK